MIYDLLFIRQRIYDVTCNEASESEIEGYSSHASELRMDW